MLESMYTLFQGVVPTFATRINWRNHRKICVIDGHIGYIGGMNIADRYIDGGESFPSWRDTLRPNHRPGGKRIAVLVRHRLELHGAAAYRGRGFPVQQQQNRNRKIGMRVLTSGPTSQWSNITYVMFKAIANAKRRIYIQTPYFLPAESLLKARFRPPSAGKSRCKADDPRRNDSRLLRNALFSYITECLRAGIRDIPV